MLLSPNTINMEPQLNFLFYATLGIFLATYVIIISEKIHRTVIALAGALLMILLGVLTQEQAIEGIDFNTLGLLIGMMIIVTIAKDCGMFQYVAILASKIGRGKPIPIFILLGGIVALFSAFLDNVTTVLLLLPVTFVVANNLNLNPKPFIVGTILLSNIGGTATLIGDPPNILIGSAAGLSFNDFLINLMPIIIVIFVVTLFLLYLWFRKTLVATAEARVSITRFKPREAITNVPLLIKSLIVIGIVLLGFFTHSMIHIEAATIALAGAALLLLLTLNDPEEHLRNVEWTTIFFFVGLFVLVAGLEHIGAIRILAESVLKMTGGDVKILTIIILWGSGIFSAIVDNIPFVATMIPLIQDIGVLSGISILPLWWALALGADIGGNATLVGASANVIVSGIAAREGHKIGFVEYLKIAVPMTVVALLLSTVYVYLRYL